MIPKEVQYNSVFSTAEVAGSKEPEAAKKLIAFLTSKKTAAAIKQSGMERLKAHWLEARLRTPAN